MKAWSSACSAAARRRPGSCNRSRWLDPDPVASGVGEGSVIVYWGVDHAETALARLLRLGATAHAPLQDVGEGIRLATVLDPFGNVLGLIENPHFAATGPRGQIPSAASG